MQFWTTCRCSVLAFSVLTILILQTQRIDFKIQTVAFQFTNLSSFLKAFENCLWRGQNILFFRSPYFLYFKKRVAHHRITKADTPSFRNFTTSDTTCKRVVYFLIEAKRSKIHFWQYLVGWRVTKTCVFRRTLCWHFVFWWQGRRGTMPPRPPPWIESYIFLSRKLLSA